MHSIFSPIHGLHCIFLVVSLHEQMFVIFVKPNLSTFPLMRVFPLCVFPNKIISYFLLQVLWLKTLLFCLRSTSKFLCMV